MTDDEIKQMIRVASVVWMDTVLGVIQSDPHQWSRRPCETCRAVTSIIGRPFGCYKYQEERDKRSKGLEDVH